MGFKKQSELRRAENEVVFRHHNERVKQQADNLLPEEDKGSIPIGFMCECSNEHCRERIQIPVEQFKKHSTNPKQFLLLPGHEHVDIEYIISQKDGYNIAEKREYPPTTDGKLNPTTTPNT